VIEQVREEYPEISIEKLCELMGVSRSWYYERSTAGKKAHRDADLRDAIELIVLEFPGYGYRRVTAALRRKGWSVNHKRVLRIMREESLLCQLKRRFVPTTHSAHAFARYPNLIRDLEIDGLDQVSGSIRTSPTSGCPRASATWRRSWTPTLAGVCGLASQQMDRHSPDAFGSS
jgi:putative transposase